jgi:excisionase family DNA binding protein
MGAHVSTRGGSAAARLLVSRREAANALSVSLRHFEEKIQPRIKTVRSGRRVLVPMAEVERWIRERAR